MITEDAILDFIPTRVSGTGFSASQFTYYLIGLNLSSGSGSVSGSGSGFRIPAFPYAHFQTVLDFEKTRALWDLLIVFSKITH